VFDYVAGKQDWLAFGLPVEGKLAQIPTIGQAAQRDVPTCGLKERLGDVQKRVRESGGNVCVVVNKERVVLGLVHKKLWDPATEASIEQMMEAGPTTFRPHITVQQMTEYMREKNIEQVLVTTSDGRLVGIMEKPK
jgi:predicted transcriptional regulator